MTLCQDNLRQIKEALSPTNRWYYGEYYKTDGNKASPDELLKYYIEHNGAKNFRKAHEESDKDLP